MFITFVYCLFIYFRATHIKFHILSSWINAPWNSLRPDWILGFGHKSLVQWEKNTHKHTYLEHIARLRTKKDEMEKKCQKIKRQRDGMSLYIFVFPQHEKCTYSYIRRMTTTLIRMLEARTPHTFIYSKHENHAYSYRYKNVDI